MSNKRKQHALVMKQVLQQYGLWNPDNLHASINLTPDNTTVIDALAAVGVTMRIMNNSRLGVFAGNGAGIIIPKAV